MREEEASLVRSASAGKTPTEELRLMLQNGIRTPIQLLATKRIGSQISHVTSPHLDVEGGEDSFVGNKGASSDSKEKENEITKAAVPVPWMYAVQELLASQPAPPAVAKRRVFPRSTSHDGAGEIATGSADMEMDAEEDIDDCEPNLVHYKLTSAQVAKHWSDRLAQVLLPAVEAFSSRSLPPPPPTPSTATDEGCNGKHNSIADAAADDDADDDVRAISVVQEQEQERGQGQ